MRETPMPPARSTPSRLPPTSMPATPTLAPDQHVDHHQAALAPPQPARTNSLDDALLRELEVTFDAGPPKKPAQSLSR